MKSAISRAMLLASVAFAAPAPMQKRTDIDSTVLNYALTLEHLESAFYAEGLKNFTKADFVAAGFTETNFYLNLKEVAADEASHVEVLTALLKAGGYNATAACEYTFPVTDAASFISLAMVLEGVGVSAYLGAAADITNKEYLTAAGSVLSTEARHNAFIRNSLSRSPFAQAYDTPLDFDEVYTLAAPFIKSCPSTNPTLPVKAFPAMAVTGTGLYPQQKSVTFSLPKDFSFPSSSVYVAWPLITGPVFQDATVNKTAKTVTCEVPAAAEGPAGQAYAILTSNNTVLTDANTLAGPAIVPVLAPYFE